MIRQNGHPPGGRDPRHERSERSAAAPAWDAAKVAEESGNLLEAYKNYQLALEARPDWYQAWNNQGLICLSLDRIDEAVTCFEKAISKTGGRRMVCAPLIIMCRRITGTGPTSGSLRSSDGAELRALIKR